MPLLVIVLLSGAIRKLASKVIAAQVLLALIAMIFMALWMWKLVGNV